MIREDKRKDEVYKLYQPEINSGEALLAGTAAPAPSSDIADDDFGESTFSSVERQQVLSFNTILKKYVITTTRQHLDPGNPPYSSSSRRQGPGRVRMLDGSFTTAVI
jgi:hypothetical protein